MDRTNPFVVALTAAAALATLESQAQARVAPCSIDASGLAGPDCNPDGYDGGGFNPPPAAPPPGPTINGLQPGGALANQPDVCKLAGSGYDPVRNLCIAGVVPSGFNYYAAEYGQTGTGYGNTAIYAEPCESGATITTDFVVTGPDDCYTNYSDYTGPTEVCTTPGYNQITCHYSDSTSAPAACPIGTPVLGSYNEIQACRVVKSPTQGNSTTVFSEASISNGDLAYSPNLGSPIQTSGGQTRMPGTLATLYIHGRADGAQRGWDYWDNYAPGAQPIWVAWNARERLSQSQQEIDAMLDSVCRTTDTGVANTCQVVCHSAGCEMITYRLSQNPGRWNVLNVMALMGAQGGSNMGILSAKIQAIRPWIQWTPLGWLATRLLDATMGLYNIDYDFQPSVARGMYDHNVSGNVPITVVSADWHMNLLHCKWWNVVCWLAAVPYDIAITLMNDALHAVHGGSSDVVLPMASTEGFNTADNGTSSCRDRWYGYRSLLGGCGVGPNIYHGHTSTIMRILNGVPATGYSGWQ